MTDTTTERAGARAALSAPGAALDESLLGAVHHGLLTVPVDSPAATHSVPDDERPHLAIRARGAI